jgi:hypothetical protein
MMDEAFRLGLQGDRLQWDRAFDSAECGRELVRFDR